MNIVEYSPLMYFVPVNYRSTCLLRLHSLLGHCEKNESEKGWKGGREAMQVISLAVNTCEGTRIVPTRSCSEFPSTTGIPSSCLEEKRKIILS